MDWNRGKDPSDKSYVSPVSSDVGVRDSFCIAPGHKCVTRCEETEYWFRIEVRREDGQWVRSVRYPELYRQAGAWNRGENLRNILALRPGHWKWDVRIVVDHPVVDDAPLEEYTVCVTYTVMAKGFDDAKLRYRSGTYVQTDVTKKES